MGIFADRFWWARQRSKKGANVLGREVGCQPTLISQIESKGRLSSRMNDLFAAALDVDPIWLAHGDASRAPEGYDDEAAIRGRMAGGGVLSVRAADALKRGRPQANYTWAPGDTTVVRSTPRGRTPDEVLFHEITDLILQYARLVGPERTLGALEAWAHVSDIVAFDRAPRENNRGAV